MSTDTKICSSPKALRTLTGEITLDFALEEEHDMLRRLTYWDQREYFVFDLRHHSAAIEDVVSYHLGLGSTGSCRLAPQNDWIHGSFNMCIPVYVRHPGTLTEKRVMIRFPLPYRIGEEFFPGNADEKLRCEAATYIWIKENCPEVHIPQLFGFGFGGDQCFTSLDLLPWYLRFSEYIRRQLRSLFSYPELCPYICHRQPHSLDNGYLLIDYIEESDGVMLSKSWEENQHDQSRRANLFRDMSRVILSLGRIPLPRIGSFTIDNTGRMSLTNRPLTVQLHMLENGNIPTNIARRDTYTAMEPYMLDLLGYHDSRLRHQPNSINNELDGRGQMASITGMRAVLPHFVDRDLRYGPFLFTLTDMHQSNIFVDKDWNIKYLIDLEWACSLPMQMQSPPHWLTSQGVDNLTGEKLVEYDGVRKEFMEAFEDEEISQRESALPEGKIGLPLLRTKCMKRTWETGGFFYFFALELTVGLFNLWGNNIAPRFSDASNLEDRVNKILAPYWSRDAKDVVTAKIKDRQDYAKQLRATFQAQAQLKSAV
ncbi:MAG: hypothetical protein Q9170_007247 [Blastenia crenularia]